MTRLILLLCVALLGCSKPRPSPQAVCASPQVTAWVASAIFDVADQGLQSAEQTGQLPTSLGLRDQLKAIRSDHVLRIEDIVVRSVDKRTGLIVCAADAYFFLTSRDNNPEERAIMMDGDINGDQPAIFGDEPAQTPISYSVQPSAVAGHAIYNAFDEATPGEWLIWLSMARLRASSTNNASSPR